MTEAMMEGVHLRLPNGWTLSIAEDTDPGRCSVVAWPTADDTSKDARFYAWGGDADRLEHRVRAADELLPILREIVAAAPPQDPSTQ